MNHQGYLAIVLHAHLPFVRHPEYEDFLEEDWLFEAISETYLPLLLELDSRWDVLPFAFDWRHDIAASAARAEVNS